MCRVLTQCSFCKPGVSFHDLPPISITSRNMLHGTQQQSCKPFIPRSASQSDAVLYCAPIHRFIAGEGEKKRKRNELSSEVWKLLEHANLSNDSKWWMWERRVGDSNCFRLNTSSKRAIPPQILLFGNYIPLKYLRSQKVDRFRKGLKWSLYHCRLCEGSIDSVIQTLRGSIIRSPSICDYDVCFGVSPPARLVCDCNMMIHYISKWIDTEVLASRQGF